jgi:hypothetical protein
LAVVFAGAPAAVVPGAAVRGATVAAGVLRPPLPVVAGAHAAPNTRLARASPKSLVTEDLPNKRCYGAR